MDIRSLLHCEPFRTLAVGIDAESLLPRILRITWLASTFDKRLHASNPFVRPPGTHG